MKMPDSLKPSGTISQVEGQRGDTEPLTVITAYSSPRLQGPRKLDCSGNSYETSELVCSACRGLMQSQCYTIS